MKFCFVASNLFPCLDRNSNLNQIGGAEVQQAAMGRELAARGLNVCYVTIDDRHPGTDLPADLEVYPTYRRTAGIPGLRFIFVRAPSFWRALGDADADVYYVRGASSLVGLVAFFARRHGRKFIFGGASDADFVPAHLRLRYSRDKFIYHYGLKHADAIVTQSEAQSRLLAKNYGLDSVTISSIAPTLPADNATPRDRLLWVANLRRLKQPSHFLSLAESLPGERFSMIGGRVSSEPDTYSATESAAQSIQNLEFLGFLGFQETETYFDRGKLLINTSYSEGFPNTFLQAWSRGTPVISYIDPDGLIERHGLGAAVRDEKGLFEAARSMLQWDEGRANRIKAFCDQRFRALPTQSLLDLIDRLTAS